ncbi:MAG: hypothetical protein TU36_001300 [Vulcanisaeta sp. AZ3]
MKLPEVEINHVRFRVLPNRYAILFMIWYSSGSSMQIHRLPLMTYISSHIIRYEYELSPIISEALINDVSKLINEGFLEFLSANNRFIVKVTEEGRRIIGEMYSMSNEYVVFGDYLIIRLKDLLNELMRIVNAYQDLNTPTLLSIALRELSIKERDLISKVLMDLSFNLRNPCENRLG